MKKKSRILSIIIIVLLAVEELFIALQIGQLSVIPAKYLLLLFFAISLYDSFLAKLLLSNGKKKSGKRILGYILSVLLVIGLLFANHGIRKIQETMDAVTQTKEIRAAFELYVRKDDNAENLNAASDYLIAVAECVDQENTECALAAIEESFGKAANCVPYDNVIAMVDALYEKEVDAMLINSAFVDVIIELEGYTDFLQCVKCIWQYDINQIVEDTVAEITETQREEHGSEYDPFIMYIGGSDNRSNKLNATRSDVNILAAINPETEQVLLINTPRDYYIPNPAGNGGLDKLTHCGIYGVDCSVKALSDLYEEEIFYYGKINFTGFETLIDAIGGVDVYSEIAFVTPYGNHSFKQGINHLNGEQALGFARDRYSLKGGDNARGQNQMKVIKAVIAQISAGNIITNYSDIMDSLQGMFATNIPPEKISSLVKLQISEMIDWDVKSYAVTGVGDSAKTYSIPGMNAYVMRPNQETVDLAIELIDKVMAGEVLTDEDLKL